MGVLPLPPHVTFPTLMTGSGSRTGRRSPLSYAMSKIWLAAPYTVLHRRNTPLRHHAPTPEARVAPVASAITLRRSASCQLSASLVRIHSLRRRVPDGHRLPGAPRMLCLSIPYPAGSRDLGGKRTEELKLKGGNPRTQQLTENPAHIVNCILQATPVCPLTSVFGKGNPRSRAGRPRV